MRVERLFLCGGEVSWAISEFTLIAFDNVQATVYHAYGFPNKSALETMRREVLLNYPEKYGNWTEVIGLALRTKIDSYGISAKTEWLSES